MWYIRYIVPIWHIIDIPYPLDLQQSINLSRFATILRIRHRRGQCSDLIMQRVIGTQQSSFSDILHAHMGLHKESTAPKRTLQKTDFPPQKKMEDSEAEKS